MGRNHVRILSSLPGAELAGVFDPSPEAAGTLVADHFVGERSLAYEIVS